jgi:hypothetical protein
MTMFLQITASAFMISLMFVGIWGFIIMNQILGQLRYKNYLLEKLTYHVHMLSSKKSGE